MKSDKIIIKLSLGLVAVLFVAFYFSSSIRTINNLDNSYDNESPNVPRYLNDYTEEDTSQGIKRIHNSGKYLFIYPNNYKVEHTLPYGFTVDLINREDGEQNAGNTFIGSFGISMDAPENTAFRRTTTTDNGYAATQYFVINYIGHPLGLGTIYTMIDSGGGRMIGIYTHVEAILKKVQLNKSLDIMENEDYLDILNSLDDYNLVINSFEFLVVEEIN